MIDLSSIGVFETDYLSVEGNWVPLIVASLIIGVSFLTIHPFIKWVVRLQSEKLLSYIICSLFTLVLCFLVTSFVGNMQHLLVIYLKVTLQGIALFGIALFVIYSVQYMVKNKRKQKSV